MKKVIYLIVFLSFCREGAVQLIAQPTSDLEHLLIGKKNFDEVMTTIDSFYSTKDINSKGPALSEYKRWLRWGWFTGSHLDENGEPVNISEKTWTEYQQYYKEDGSRHPLEDERSRTNSGGWAPIGPNTILQGLARVDRLAFDPFNANIMYAGTPAGGLFKTVNAGANWFPLNGYLPNVGVSGIIVDADNPSTLYVLTGDGDSNISGFVEDFGYIRSGIGLLKSSDGGITWNKISNIVLPTESYFGFKLIQLNNFHNIFFACTSRGLYRSADNGLTWVRDVSIGDQNVYDIEDASNGFVYASTNNRVFISNNSGNTFTMVPVSAFVPQPNIFTNRTSVMISPNQPNSLYVHFGGFFNNGEEKLLFRSNDNGSNFTQAGTNAPRTQRYMAGMTALRTDFNTVLIGEVILSRSTDGGFNFSMTGGGIVHADVHEIHCHPLNANVYVACDGGIYVSSDNGANWSSLFNGIQASQFYHMTGVLGQNGLILGGAQDNGTIQSDDTGNTYRRELGGDGFEAAFLNGNNNQYYFTLNTSVFHGQREPYFAIDKTPAGATAFYPSIAIHPGNDEFIYAGYANGVYRSDNNGLSWFNTGASGSAGGSPAGGLAVSAQMPDRIYAANDITLWRSDFIGNNWNIISTNPGFPAITPATPITDISSRFSNGDEIWVTLGGYSNGNKVFYSENAGATWINFSGTLPNVPVHCIKYTAFGDVYIGTDIGVFFMDDNMSDWVPFSNGLPLVPVSDLFINEISNTIKASTFGRGVWQGDLYSDCGPSIFLSDTIPGRNFYQCNGFIETDAVITGSIGNELRLKSPDRVSFKPGFKIGLGAYLHAVIGNCGQGVVNLNRPGEDKALSKSEVLKTRLTPSSGG